MKAAKTLFYWLLFVGYMGLLFWLSSRRPSAAMSLLPDKVFHAAAFFGLCIVSRLAIGTIVRGYWITVALAVFVSVVYGALDEWHQSFTPYRVPDIHDWYADVAGALIAGALLVVMGRIWRDRKAAHKSIPPKVPNAMPM